MSDLPDCRFRGDIRDNHAQCTSGWVLAPRSGVTLSFCVTCPYADRAGGPAPHRETSARRIPDRGTCSHRGEVIRQQKADLCGLKGLEFPVHACAVHGECTDRRVCRKATVRACSTCNDWVN